MDDIMFYVIGHEHLSQTFHSAELKPSSSLHENCLEEGIYFFKAIPRVTPLNLTEQNTIQHSLENAIENNCHMIHFCRLNTVSFKFSFTFHFYSYPATRIRHHVHLFLIGKQWEVPKVKLIFLKEWKAYCWDIQTSSAQGIPFVWFCGFLVLSFSKNINGGLWRTDSCGTTILMVEFSAFGYGQFSIDRKSKFKNEIQTAVKSTSS